MRYRVDAVIEVDGWAYVEADTQGEAVERATEMALLDFELGDAFAFGVVEVEEDE